MDGAVPDLGDLAVEIMVASPGPEERLKELFTIWTERCPIYLALLKPNAVETTFTAKAAG